MGAKNELPTIAKDKLDINWGQLKSTLISLRNTHNRAGVEEIIRDMIYSYKELPYSVLNDYWNIAMKVLDIFGDNFFKGDI